MWQSSLTVKIIRYNNYIITTANYSIHVLYENRFAYLMCQQYKKMRLKLNGETCDH